MMGFKQLYDEKLLQSVQNIGKPIITYTPISKEDIIKTYQLPISGMLVDDMPFARSIIDEIETHKDKM
jgi:hypothetical protein